MNSLLSIMDSFARCRMSTRADIENLRAHIASNKMLAALSRKMLDEAYKAIHGADQSEASADATSPSDTGRGSGHE